jgi:lysophospholipase L1-like esterase
MRTIVALAVVGAALANAWAAEPQGRAVTVALVGDSTVTDEAGWGKAFADRFDDRVRVLNFAASGRSSKSWFDERRLPRALEAKPDYVLIQFGHNDQPGKGPHRETDPATTYRDSLKIYLKEFQAIGARPILVSSVTRRTFDDHGKIASTLTPWAEAARDVAREAGVPFIDLHAVSVAHHDGIGRDASMAFNLNPTDMTHFSRQGAEAVADLIVGELATVSPDLASYLKGSAPQGSADGRP